MLGMKKQTDSVSYTVYNIKTGQCLGKDYSLNTAMEVISSRGSGWVFYETDTQILDSVVGLVEDHCS